LQILLFPVSSTLSVLSGLLTHQKILDDSLKAWIIVFHTLCYVIFTEHVVHMSSRPH